MLAVSVFGGPNRSKALLKTVNCILNEKIQSKM